MPRATHFGYRTVDEEEKASLVHGVFDRVAARYAGAQPRVVLEHQNADSRTDSTPRMRGDRFRAGFDNSCAHG